MKTNICIPLLFSWLLMYSNSLSAQEPIKIQHLENKPIVVGEINGRKAYFLLDTGSDLTLLHENKATYYDFKIKKMVKPQCITGANGRIGEINRAGDVELFLGTLPITTAYFTYDLSGIIQSIYHKTFIRISGIIGSDVMIRYGFVIDYGKEEVHYDQSLAEAVVPAIRKE
jgi:hypothetical protein